METERSTEGESLPTKKEMIKARRYNELNINKWTVRQIRLRCLWPNIALTVRNKTRMVELLNRTAQT